MFLTKYKPTAFESLFDTNWFPMLRPLTTEAPEDLARTPLTDIRETDNEYVLTLEMPGVEKKDINVSVEDDQLIISGGGERTEKTEEPGVIRKEIRSSHFRRTFRMNSAIDRDKIKARLENGVLAVSLPKAEKAIGRRIEIV